MRFVRIFNYELLFQLGGTLIGILFVTLVCFGLRNMTYVIFIYYFYHAIYSHINRGDMP